MTPGTGPGLAAGHPRSRGDSRPHCGFGISTSSLYAAFGSKGGLFEEVVRIYAERCRTIYENAVHRDDIDLIAELHRVNGLTLLTRVERAVAEGQLPADISATTLIGLVQAVWHGLSVQSSLGTGRAELLAYVQLAVRQVRHQRKL